MCFVILLLTSDEIRQIEKEIRDLSIRINKKIRMRKCADTELEKRRILQERLAIAVESELEITCGEIGYAGVVRTSYRKPKAGKRKTNKYGYKAG